MPLSDRIASYAAGPAKLRRAVAGLSEAELKAFPVPGTWSIQQNLMHLMDSDLIASDRMKRIIAEENPLIAAYDETKFANALFYHDQSAAAALDIFELNRRQTAVILSRLPESALSRTGRHTERGPITLLNLIDTYIGHVDHHLKFVLQKRALLGK